VRNAERIARFRELVARNDRHAADLRAHRKQARALVESGSDDADRATELLERLAQLEAERDAILAELARVDPAFTASCNR
jgi:hypothetical protein